MIWRRIKNLWALSAYRVGKSAEILDERIKVLEKDVPTIKHKPATIIKESVDYFKEENGETS